MIDRIESQWAERYERAGFKKKDIKFYEETPLADRQKNEAWRKLDAVIVEDLMRCARSTPKKERAPEVIGDSLGLEGVKSHADGKMYDSKSRYYQSLKDKDSHIVEKGENAYHAIPNSTLRGDFDCSKELKQAIQQHLR